MCPDFDFLSIRNSFLYQKLEQVNYIDFPTRRYSAVKPEAYNPEWVTVVVCFRVLKTHKLINVHDSSDRNEPSTWKLWEGGCMACVAGVRKGREKELGRETTREGGGRRGGLGFGVPFLSPSRAKFPLPLPLLTPATQARDCIKPCSCSCCCFSTIHKAPTRRRKKDYCLCAPSRCRP